MTTVRKKRSLEARRNSWGWFFVAPGILFFSTFSLYPICNALWTSFHNKKLLSLKPPKFIGLQNYAKVLSSPDFWNSVRASATFCLGVFLPIFIASLLFGVLIASRTRGRRFYQLALYSPAILSSVVTASVWAIMFDPRGLANQLVNGLMGTPGIDRRWLADSTMVQISTMLVYIWKTVGYYTILFVTGIGKIPASVIEASIIDGANPWQRLTRITMPLLKPTMALVSVMIFIGSLKTFSTQYLFTQRGAPLEPINVLTLNIYNTALYEQNLGRASVMSLLLFATLLVLSGIQVKAAGSGEDM
ncbi:MAG: sugar ABC transporter permease [Spirochaetes bacterium]|nr:sugar ABC transporter permease [Spirochaetota bacterium]MBU1079942.1 sugar ABC transporter permease [Spirochaetota bacterium]